MSQKLRTFSKSQILGGIIIIISVNILRCKWLLNYMRPDIKRIRDLRFRDATECNTILRVPINSKQNYVNKFLIWSHYFRGQFSRKSKLRSRYNSLYSRTCVRIGPRAFRVASAADTFPEQTRRVVTSRVRTASTNWSYLRARLIAKRFYRIST